MPISIFGRSIPQAQVRKGLGSLFLFLLAVVASPLRITKQIVVNEDGSREEALTIEKDGGAIVLSGDDAKTLVKELVPFQVQEIRCGESWRFGGVTPAQADVHIFENAQ